MTLEGSCDGYKDSGGSRDTMGTVPWDNRVHVMSVVSTVSSLYRSRSEAQRLDAHLELRLVDQIDKTSLVPLVLSEFVEFLLVP